MNNKDYIIFLLAGMVMGVLIMGIIDRTDRLNSMRASYDYYDAEKMMCVRP